MPVLLYFLGGRDAHPTIISLFVEHRISLFVEQASCLFLRMV
ncbi:hypothetical protein [Microcoleus vaginatus]